MDDNMKIVGKITPSPDSYSPNDSDTGDNVISLKEENLSS